ATGEEIDHRSDLYSLGCTFYHLLTGSPPFDGPSAVVIAAKHVVERPRPIQRLAPGVPRSLCTIIGRMMERDPSRRYDSHDELIADLQAAAPGAIAPGGIWTRAAAAAVDAAAAGLAISAVGWIGLVAYLATVAAAQAWGGRTLGKYLMNLRVQQVDGRAMGIGRALARTVVSMWFPFLAAAVLLLSGGFGQLTVAVEQLQPSQLPALQALVTAAAVSHAMTFALYLAGMGIAALHPQKRAAHDLICGTRVVYEMGAPA
ncbi:MAG: RDD family protein, partial [Deltaproteobacteria bacterium]|nr:RDD family protein [Deltaproteobacteria bacterium]